MSKTKNSGFTLIELLVVITIIGILSSVILAQLNTSRNKGTDASIKSTMNNASGAAQLYYDIHTAPNSTWNLVCTASNGLGPIMARLAQIANNGVAACSGSGQNGWRAHAQLKYQTGYWCADYTGTKKLCTNVPSGFTCAPGC